jgi:NAD(P)-dependent dehydrogenase (short-subunit alcohol dehydrogenase family)
MVTFQSSFEISPDEIQKSFAINVFGPLFMVRAVVPHMPQGGRIINVSSTASKMGPSSMPVYGASKAALDSLTYSWAAEVRELLCSSCS